MEKKNVIYVAAKVERTRSYDVTYVKDSDIARLFRCYNNGFEGFIFFCFGCVTHRAPNQGEMLRFTYCPISGKKIDWNKIYEAHKHEFNDYDKELEKEIKSGVYRSIEVYPEHHINNYLGY
jgi:hypothetical protein